MCIEYMNRSWEGKFLLLIKCIKRLHDFMKCHLNLSTTTFGGWGESFSYAHMSLMKKLYRKTHKIAFFFSLLAPSTLTNTHTQTQTQQIHKLFSNLLSAFLPFYFSLFVYDWMNERTSIPKTKSFIIY